MNLTMVVYLTLIAMVLVLVVLNIFSEEKPTKQVTAVMVIIPLLLRLFLVN